MSLAVGDIVRVVKQPDSLIVHIEGEVGYITEIQGEWANIQTMRVDGARGGAGGVPLNCLVLETGEQWKHAREKIEEEDAKYQKEYEHRTAKWNAFVEQVANKYGISVETAHAIHEELGNFDQGVACEDRVPFPHPRTN
jgi:hypothetical protein